MSSDSDEDELLQMALKEQAERNLNYQRPPSSRPSKPVVNLIQPPPPPPFLREQQQQQQFQQHQQYQQPQQRNNQRASPAQAAGRHPRKQSRGGHDDDDSEVELLSISSGDEDASSKDRAPLPPKGKAIADRRSSRDDDHGWDDDEPRMWKRVDEGELARRVREMRETRAVPVSQTLDRKGSVIGRKGLNHIQSLPRGVEVLDPLGLGVIDNKSLRLITEASDSSPIARDRSDTLDRNSREKVMYYSPNFDAKVFLSHVHQDTSAADLESGALSLKTDLKGRTQQKKQLVKENFDCFVSCKTTIDDIESKLRQIEEDPEGAGTAHLHDATKKISDIANRAFQPLFERQIQAEKIRSVQGMLQRFRTLFNLPSTIRGSIIKGEYDLAVREYKKAKSIVLPSHVGILKRVLEEVEKVMQDFKSLLYKSMEDPQLDLTELENSVRLLLELEPDSDPVWHYLNIQSRIWGLLEKCTIDHDAKMERLQSEIREKAQSDARWKQLQLDLNNPIDGEFPSEDSLLSDSQLADFAGTELDALRGRYIRRLTAVVVHHIPAFWRLALSVFSGKFAKVTTGSALDSEATAKPISSKSEEKVGDMKYLNHSLEEVAAMIQKTLSVYESKVNYTFQDLEESNILQPHMTDAIKEIAEACQFLEGKDSAPPTAVQSMHALHFEIAKIYILRLCTWMRSTTEEISKEEMWIPLSALERNKSPYTMSFLPLAFKAMETSAMDRIDDMIQNLRSVATKSEELLMQIQEIQESVRIAFLNSFLDFAGCLERIGANLAQSRPNKENSYLQNGYTSEAERESCALNPGGAVTGSHKKLLIVLSNIGYCKEELSCALYSKYKHIWLQSRDNNEQNGDVRDLVSSFSALEEKVLGHYTFAKSSLIRTAALKYLLDSGVQWGGAPAVKGIRDATIELLHTLVDVHAEVFTGAKPLLEKTLGILVEGLIDTFLSLFNEYKSKELKSLDANGFCQLMLELEYFETVLHSYFSPDAHESFKSLQGLLLDKACESASEVPENPGHHRRPTRGSEDAASDDRQGSTVSPDDLLALAHQYNADLLEGELERTRLNIACFMESSIQPAIPPGSAKSRYSSPFHEIPSSPSYRRQQTASSTGSARQRRR